jgi:peptide/nickel transport system substrate-binding protein
MPRRLWLSAGLLATGAVLLATARFAGASPPSAGIFRVGFVGASVQIDPQVSYITTGWWMEYATAAKLYNWTDRGTKLVPEVASRVVISNRGRTYTFFLRKGFRFSDGSPVTAKSFSYAIDRVANHDLASPGAAFITDSSGTEIVGAQKVNQGLATHVRGVQAKGRFKLVIRLVRPDPAFISKLAMPFFQATSTTLPLSQEIVTGYPSAGPYYFASNEANTLTSLRRNRYWHGHRPAHLDGVDVQWGLDEETGFHEVDANQLDEGPLPASEAQGVVNRFGVNKTRFWSMPTNCLGYLALNSQRPIFHRVAMRKAVNWAVNRTAIASEAGVAAGSPWTHLLPPLFPGSITKKRLQPYSMYPNLKKARKLAGGFVQSQRIRVAYRDTTSGQAQAEVVRQELVQLGFKAQNITLIGFSGGAIYTAMGSQGSNLDLGVALGWCSDYPDASNPLSFFLGPPFGVASKKYRDKLARVNRLPEPARTRALGRLDLEITNNLAPAAVLRTYNNRYFFSNRVDPHSLAYSGAYQDWSIPALALK